MRDITYGDDIIRHVPVQGQRGPSWVTCGGPARSQHALFAVLVPAVLRAINAYSFDAKLGACARSLEQTVRVWHNRGSMGSR